MTSFSSDYDFDGKVILVTGGTGSFGKAFVKRVLLNQKPHKLIIFSRDEQKQFDMQMNPVFAEHAKVLRYFIGDVRDYNRLEMALREVDIVVHAAAMKHVPAAEYNPMECIKTNVHGAENLVMAAIRNKVQKVLALSTDKAVNPLNLYGASKLAADKIFVAANSLSGDTGPRFAVARYGNVLGSRGSIIPFFQRLTAEGAKELPITDERMTRFWITLEAGVDFVLSSIAIMKRGEIFIPKIPSMSVVDLALSIAPDMPQKFVGIRPGEKLHEVMVTEDDARNTIELSDRFVIRPTLYPEWCEGYGLGDKPLEDGFRYSSDNNTDWLSREDMQKLLTTTNIES
jgi:UDP-N-acetylglucosamine 4,6-dehydratase/5-epimerase